MDVCLLQDEIIKNPEHIELILEKLGHDRIKDKGTYYQCRNIGGDNDTGCSVKKDNLVWNNWSHGKSGSIWTMVQDELSCSFKDSLNIVANWIGFKCDYVKRRNPFGGFYKEISEYANNKYEVDLQTYDESILPNVMSNMKFLNDGVSLQVQEKWKLSFDHNTNGIIIPWRDMTGQLIGAKWRNNDPKCDMNKRWGMYIRFPVSQAVYGWNENYNTIINRKDCIIFEAEKSVMQLESFGLPNIGLAVGGHNISDVQVRKIKAMFPRRVIIAFDSGICEDEIVYNAKKFKSESGLHNIKIGYVYDKSGIYLRDKDSPTDNGLEEFRSTLKNCIKYIA